MTFQLNYISPKVRCQVSYLFNLYFHIPFYYRNKLLLISLWSLIMLMLYAVSLWSVGCITVCQISIFGPKKCTKCPEKQSVQRTKLQQDKIEDIKRTKCIKDNVYIRQSIKHKVSRGKSVQRTKCLDNKVSKGQSIKRTKCINNKVFRGQSVQRKKVSR